MDHTRWSFLKRHAFYEARPWFCLCIGALAITQGKESRVMLLCSLTLLVCGSLMLGWRKAYRKHMGEPVRASNSSRNHYYK